MIKLNFKTILNLVLTASIVLCPFLAYTATDNGQVEASSYDTQMDKDIQLKLTHTLFTAVIYSYFKEGDDKFRAEYLGDKQYIVAFLNKWYQLIETGQFNTTKDIFKHIQNSKGYLAKYYSLWSGLSNPYDISINLGNTKNGSLYVILESEALPLEKRILRILDDVIVSISGSSHDYELAAVIAQAFVNVDNEAIRNKAAGALENKSLHQTVEILTFVRDLYLGGKVLTSTGLAAPKLANLGQQYSTARSSLFTWARASGIGAWMAIQSSKGADYFRKINPFLKSIPKIHLTVGASAAAHLGVLFWPASSNEVEAASTAVATPQYDPLIISFYGLWENINRIYPQENLHTQKNLQVGFQPQTANEIGQRILDALRTGSPIDYLDVFLKSEKLQNIDGRDNDDFQVMDFAYGKIQKNRKRIKKELKDKPLNLEAIASIRKMLIEEDLVKYKRDYPNLTSLYLGWGGNCVAETMLMAGMFKPLEQRLKSEANLNLGVVLLTEHIETVLYNEDYVMFTISGKKISRKNRTIYRPEFLLLGVLKTLGVDTNLTPTDFIVKSTEASPGKFRSADYAQNMDSTNAWFQRLYERVTGDSRQGVLKTLNDATRNEGWDESGNNERQIIPESAIIDFTDFYETEEVSDRYSSAMRSDGSGSGSGYGSGFFESLFQSIRSGSGSGSSANSADRPIPQIRVLLDKSMAWNPYGIEYGVQKDSNDFVLNATIKASSEKEFYKILELRKKSNGSYSKFKIALRKYYVDKTMEIINSSEFNRLIRNPLSNVNEVLSLSAEDIQRANSYLNIFLNNIFEPERHYEVVGNEVTLLYAQDYLQAHKVGEEPFMYNYRDRTHINIFEYDSDLASKLLNEANQLGMQFYASPAGFLKIYNEANLVQRGFILEAYLGDRGLLNSLASQFDPYNEEKKMALATDLFINARIKNYIQRLSTVKIDHVRNNCYLPYSKIQLPVAERDGGILIDDPVQNISPECTDENSRAENQSYIKEETKDLASVKIESISFKPHVLIELTLQYGAGLHLWDEATVNLFVNNRYGEIVVDHTTALRLIKAMLEHNPPEVITPALAILLDYFKIKNESNEITINDPSKYPKTGMQSQKLPKKIFINGTLDQFQ